MAKDDSSEFSATLKVTDEVRDQVKEAADVTGLTRNYVIGKAVELMMETPEFKAIRPESEAERFERLFGSSTTQVMGGSLSAVKTEKAS